MSLKEVSLRSLALKQYAFKVKGYSNLFYGLLIAQILGLLFSLGGVMTQGFGSGINELTITVKDYSADLIIVFSIFWIMITAATIANKTYKNMEFSLITHRLSSNLSNIGFLLTASIFAGTTVSFSGALLRMIGYFMFDHTQTLFKGFLMSPANLLFEMVVTSLCLILFSSVGYFGGTLVELNKSFYIIIPVLTAGFLKAYGQYLTKIYLSFFNSTLLLFTFKILILSILLFGLSSFISNRMEVRK